VALENKVGAISFLEMIVGVRVEGKETPMKPERAWFLSEGEKSEG
jgi:hypothetical protein